MPSPFSRTTRSLANDSARSAWIVWLVASLSLCLWLLWFFFSHVTVFEVSRKARVEAGLAPHTIAAITSGKVLTTHLAIGQHVQAGDLLVAMDTANLEVQAREEQSRIESHPFKIDSLRREIESKNQALEADTRSTQAAAQSAMAHLREADAGIEFARDNQRRMTEESQAGSIAQIDALRARSESLKLQSSKDALSADLNKLQFDAKTRARLTIAEIENLKRALITLQDELSKSQANLAQINLAIENHKVRAPISGIVGEIQMLRPGAYLTEGQKLATIIPRGNLIIIAEFDPASSMGRLSPGQHARLRLDGFPWTQFGSVEAKVLRVASEIRDQSLRVELALIPNQTQQLILRHGLTGKVEIDVESINPATLLLRNSSRFFSQSFANSAATPNNAAGAAHE